ncbi:MAG TPA: nucleoside triphosphate pyrophosphohydrolase family protein [Thermoleophilaceae bacterium]|nr:nucleoside triphosphate pyrophosphohydrolase family protein [Thermoleophilaceae bacterium]
MDFKTYQTAASTSDQVPTGDHSVIVPLLGLAGEAGSLLVAQKKFLRDGPAHRLFREEVAEELGDLLWYISNLATKFDLDLETIAAANLRKTQERWPSQPPEGPGLFGAPLFDEAYPAEEQFPRRFTAEIRQVAVEDGKPRIVFSVDGKQIGNELKDNAYFDDGYRFHDVIHLAHVAMLGWSPVVRGLMRRKRKSDPEVDDVEDGGRAIVIDEAIVAYVFDYARRHDFLEGVDSLDYNLLKTIRHLTSGLEVAARSTHEWEQAILAGYRVWREIRAVGGGIVRVDLLTRQIEAIPPAEQHD